MAVAGVVEFSIWPLHAGTTQLLLVLAIAVAGYFGGWKYALAALLIATTSMLNGRSAGLAELIEYLSKMTALAALSTWVGQRFAHFREADAKLRALLAAIDDLMLVLDESGTYVEVGPTSPSLLLRPADDLLGRRVHDFFEKEQAEFFVSNIRRALDEHQTIHVDYSLHKDGKVLWFSAAVSPLNATQVMWIARDITIRKLAEKALQTTNTELEERVAFRTRELSATIALLNEEMRRSRVAEAALQQSEKRHRTLVEQASDIIFTIDAKGCLTSLNPAFERIIGWRAQDWIGRSFIDLLHPRDKQTAQEQFVAASGEDAPSLIRAVVKGSAGQRIVFEVSRTRKLTDGNADIFLGYARDITAHEESQAALRESEKRFRLLAQSTSDAVWDFDLRTGTVWRGNQYETLFGYAVGDVPPTIDAWLDLVHPDDRARVESSYREAIANGELSWSSEYRFQRADGTYATILDRGYVLRDGHDSPVRVLGAMMDITDRKRLAEQLAQANRISGLGRITTSMAHEFNNVLMGIQPQLEIIRRRSGADVSQQVEHIMGSVRRGKRITEEILRYTRPADPVLQSVALGPFLENWTCEIAPLLGNSIEVRVDVENENLWMYADPLQIAQVLTNLALNARDAMSGGGHLYITAGKPGNFGMFGRSAVANIADYVHLRVRDEGSGMTAEQRLHVFEPLFTTKANGTGLGLAVSYQIVDRHAGQMAVEAELGVGTTFHILLPRAEPQGVAQDGVAFAEDRGANQGVQPQRVLIVEDEAPVSSGMRVLFELEDIDVEVVTTGAAAVPAIERFRPDVVVLDVGLPDISGDQIYLTILARWPDLPVVFSSGHADPTNLDAFLRRGNVDLLVKPYDFMALQESISRVMSAGVEALVM